MREEDVDILVRRVLTPPASAAARVARAALACPAGTPRGRRLPVAAGALAAVVLLVALAAVLRSRAPQEARAAAVYSVGALVVGVPATGTSWIVGPGSNPASSGPRVIVVKGANP